MSGEGEGGKREKKYGSEEAETSATYETRFSGMRDCACRGDGTVDIDDLHSQADGWRRGGRRVEAGGGEEVQRAGLLSLWTGGAAPSQTLLTGWKQMEARTEEGGMVVVVGRGIKVVMSLSKVGVFWRGRGGPSRG